MLQTGLLTTAAALAIVYLMSSGKLFGGEFNIMGFYLNYVLPVGALAVGFVAGSGYGGAAWYTGFKLGRGTLLLILVFQIIAYFVAQYIEFAQVPLVYEDTGQPVGFWDYFHLLTVSWAWKQDDGTMGKAMGMWGYAFRTLEIGGFALGGLILPGIQMKRPYCEACRQYKKTREIGYIAASVPLRKIAKDDAAARQAYEDEQQKMMDDASSLYERLKELAGGGQAEAFQQEIASRKITSKEASKLPIRLRVEMEHCSGCMNGVLSGSMLIGKGEKVRIERLPGSPVPPEFVNGMVSAR